MNNYKLVFTVLGLLLPFIGFVDSIHMNELSQLFFPLPTDSLKCICH